MCVKINVLYVQCIVYVLHIQYLLKTTGHLLARVTDFHVFFVKFKTVKCDFKAFVSKKYKKKNL